MQSLEKLRNPLLEVHRALLDSERGQASPAEFLQALIHDPQLEWIQPLTKLVASLDGLLDDAEFQKRYREALQRDPRLAIAHGRLASGV